MKEAFITKRFNRNSRSLIGVIATILDDYREAGYDLSLRQLYYQLVARDIVPNTERSYKNIGELVSDARLAGLLDWDMIRDRGRVQISNPHWDSPADILDASAQQFRIDLWADQPSRVLVMVEKQALEGVLIPVCQECDVQFMANKGYSSSSALYEIGKAIGRRMRRDRQRTVIIYLGDHDPSGIDMTRDVLERISLFAGYTVEVQRVALNMPQIEELQPPENPAKITDSRFAEYQRQYGDSSWELDAIEPKRLAQIVTDAVMENVDHARFSAAVERQTGLRCELQEAADSFRAKDEETEE